MRTNPFDPGYYETDELRSFGFRTVGRNVRIDKSCTIIGLGNIGFGNDVRIDGGVSIIAPQGFVEIGSFVHIGGGCHISGVHGVVMGDFSGLSQGVRLYSATDDYVGDCLTNPTVPAEFLNIKAGRISLGKHVIVGSGSVVLPGVAVAAGTAIGALSLVRKDTEEWGVYAGNPARRIRERGRGALAKEREMRDKYPHLFDE